MQLFKVCAENIFQRSSFFKTGDLKNRQIFASSDSCYCVMVQRLAFCKPSGGAGCRVGLWFLDSTGCIYIHLCVDWMHYLKVKLTPIA